MFSFNSYNNPGGFLIEMVIGVVVVITVPDLCGVSISFASQNNPMHKDYHLSYFLDEERGVQRYYRTCSRS